MSYRCRLFGCSRQRVYQRLSSRRPRQSALEPVHSRVLEVRRSLPRLGTRQRYDVLKATFESQGIKRGQDSFFGDLRKHPLFIQPARSDTQTTPSKDWMKTPPNRSVDRALYRPEHAFVSDLTWGNL